MSSSPLSSPLPSSPTFESAHKPEIPSTNDHLLVVSRLRPRKRASTPTLVTPTRGLAKRTRHRRNSSSPLPAWSSPYRNLTESSPYIFDKGFYNNCEILNGDLTPSGATYGAANNRHEKHLHKAHKTIINRAILDDDFKPLPMPDPARLMRAHLPDSCTIDDPTTFFELFLGNE
jgi:hypothetical protein